MSKYIYENKIKECPNCGALLNKNDKECPNCSVNLVGLNEKQNRIINLNNSAEKIEEIALQKSEIGKKINIETQKKNKAQAIVSITLGIIVTLIIGLFIIGNNADKIEEISQSNKFQTFEQVKDNFKNESELKNIELEMSNVELGDLKNQQDSKINNGFNQKYHCKTYYNNQNSKTSISFGHYGSEYDRTFTFTYDKDTIFVPEIDMMHNEISYRTKNGISINHTFESIYNFENIDDYILDSYIREEKNIASKYGTLKLIVPKSNLLIDNKKELTFNAYIIERAGNIDEPRLIFATKLDDDTIYEIKITAYQMESIYEIVDNLEKYIRVSYNEMFIGNLD